MRESHFILFEKMGKTNIHAMQRKMHHRFEPSEEFPMEENKKEKKSNGRGTF
jgi:hypothetical protein